MLSENSKEEISSIIERLKEEVIRLHSYIETSDHIDGNTYDDIYKRIDTILIIISHLENQIYFS